MAAETAKQFDALEASSQTLMTCFTRAGFEAVAPAIIQPAGVFLDVIGETLRARTYVFTDPDGDELCMRPDLTVPACRLHLERHPAADRPAKYCYNGPAFRFQAQGADRSHTREFRQTGIEAFGEADRERAEAEIVGTIVTALQAANLSEFTLRLGDLGLLRALLTAADMPSRWRPRLKHQIWPTDAFRAELNRLTTQPGSTSAHLPKALRDALDPENPAAAEAVVAAFLEENGTDIVGVRSVAEIADNLLARVADATSDPLSPKTAQLIASYVAISAPAHSATKRMSDLATLMGVDIGAALGAYERRLDLLANAGVDVDRAEFAAEFGRALEYYTGFVFEVITQPLGRKSPVAGGGRYDDLMRAAGSPRDVAAVGAAVHTERLVAAIKGGAL